MKIPHERAREAIEGFKDEITSQTLRNRLIDAVRLELEMALAEQGEAITRRLIDLMPARQFPSGGQVPGQGEIVSRHTGPAPFKKNER